LLAGDWSVVVDDDVILPYPMLEWDFIVCLRPQHC
jgi:hypothetical protein